MKKTNKKNLDIFGLKELEIGEVYVDWIFSIIKPFIKERILEIGIGLGLLIDRLKNKELVIASDINEDFLDTVKKKYKTYKNIKYTKLDIEKVDNDELKKLSKEGIDTVIAVNTLEHIEDDLKSLRNIYRILVNKGRLIIFVPAVEQIYGSLDRSFGHFRRYTKNDLISKLVKSGFSIDYVKFFNLFGIFWWFIMGIVFKKENLPNMSGLLLRFLVPILWKIESKINIPIGQSLIIIAKK